MNVIVFLTILFFPLIVGECSYSIYPMHHFNCEHPSYCIHTDGVVPVFLYTWSIGLIYICIFLLLLGFIKTLKEK